MGRPQRILHVDGDSFFASCEVAEHPAWQGRPVWVGGALVSSVYDDVARGVI